MRKLLFFFNILFAAGMVSAQTPSASENYVYSKTYLSEDGTRKNESVQYFDGLGRLKQTVSVKSATSGKDLVTPVFYDELGRQAKDFLPLPMPTANLGIHTVSETDINTYYGVPNAYVEKVFDRSPLARVLEVATPGEAWKKNSGHTRKSDYETNISADQVKKYVISSSWADATVLFSIPSVTWYAENQLMKSTVTDEDGNKSITFKNSRGQAVLVRKMDGAIPVDTYYIYNLYGQMVLVIPPLADREIGQAGNMVTQAVLDRYCYQYKYDNRNRLVEKWIPGKNFWEYFVYDKQGRQVLSQDANQHLKQWTFKKYDKLGRLVYSGLFANTSSRAAMQNALNSMASNALNNESRSSTPFTAGGQNIYYTKTAFPTGSMTVLSVNYYDDYAPEAPARPAAVLGRTTLTAVPAQYSSGGIISYRSLKGMATSSYIKNIEDDKWTQSHIWYDPEGRPVGTHTVNHLGGYTKTETELDFTGVVQHNKIYHKRLTSDPEKLITEIFEYDVNNRLLAHKHQVDGNTVEMLSQHIYNDLGQLINKKVGNNLQSIDYAYNIKGDLLRVNNPADLNGRLFGYELAYENPQNVWNTTGKYNGDITEVRWKTASDQVLRQYSYQYDMLNRLKNGIYSEPASSVPGNHFFNESVEYDLGGNITSLQRNAKAQFSSASELIDNLTYTYTGNRLNTVTDISANYRGYPDTSGSALSYDDNGNMKTHTDKGILQIDYNFLNLPKYVKFNESVNQRKNNKVYVNTVYLYRADGTKLRKLYNYKDFSQPDALSIKTTDYLDGFQYEYDWVPLSGIPTGDFQLKFVPTSEGYYDFEKNRYIYSYTDHLGNIRLSYFKNASGSAEVLEENNFYPFGMKHEGYNQTVGNHSYHYGFNGKELQKETGWGDFGARMYMSDIGRWGVIDPLAESYRRWSPYHYAMNNPANLTDPDGMGSYDANGNWRSEMADFNEYHHINYSAGGREYNSFRANDANGGNGGGGVTTTVGQLMDSFGIKSGNLNSVMELNVVLNLRQQLINSGWDNPESISAKFNDWWKLVSSKEIPSLNELYKITKAQFEEDPNLNSPGATSWNLISINISKNKNLLEYAFTIGHEMYGHVFANLFFKDKFSEITGISTSSPRSFKFFQEVMGIKWEIDQGATRYGERSAINAAEFYYGGIGHGQSIIDRVRTDYSRLNYEWNKIYNIQKNKIK